MTEKFHIQNGSTVLINTYFVTGPPRPGPPPQGPHPQGPQQRPPPGMVSAGNM